MSAENKTLEIALRYLEKGWSVIPVKQDKTPYLGAWKNYQERIPTKEEVVDWFCKIPNAGIGIITGRLSGIVVLDLDPGCDETRLEEFNLPRGMSVETPRGGKHLYFKHPGIDVKSRTDLFGDNSHIDVRGDGGYVVAPPTLREDGKDYKWINRIDEFLLGELPPKLIDIINNKPKADQITHTKEKSLFEGVPEGQRNDMAARITGFWISRLSNEEWESEAWPKLIRWNQTNLPPLEEKELRRIFLSICRYERTKRGEGGPNQSIVSEAIIFKDLLSKEFPLPQWAVSGIFEAETVNMISGAPNHFKSWVVNHVAICLASGEKVFGHFPVTQQRVMIVNEEDNERMLKTRSLALIDEVADLPIFFHVAKGFRIDDTFVERLLPEIQSKEVKFLILDSLRSLHFADENQSREMQEILDHLKKISRKGVTILFTHHHRKAMNSPFGNKKEMSGSEDFRGSSAILASVFGHISCEVKTIDDKEYLIIVQHKLKTDEKIPPFKVLITKDKEKGKLSFDYADSYDNAVDGRNKLMDEVFAELDFSGWKSIKDLMRESLGSERSIREAVRGLMIQKRIIGKTRKELQMDGVELTSTGKVTEVFYSLPTIASTYEPDTPGF